MRETIRHKTKEARATALKTAVDILWNTPGLRLRTGNLSANLSAPSAAHAPSALGAAASSTPAALSHVAWSDRWLARFNRRYTDRLARHIAGWAPGFGIVRHTGRRSGRIYETPVNVFRTEGGFAFALTYGRGDWVSNVIDAGAAQVLTRRHEYAITNPRIIRDPQHRDLPFVVRQILKLIDVDEELRVDCIG